MDTTRASFFSGVLFSWEEKVSSGTDSLTKKFHVVCRNTNQLWTIGYSPNTIRAKFGLLLTLGIFSRIAFVFARTILLLKGNFIDFAKMRARHEWVNSLDCEKDDAYDRYRSRLYKAVPLEFLKEAGKTLLMAIAILPVTIIGLFGLVFPYDARKLMGDLEQLYAPAKYNIVSSFTPCMPDQAYRIRETLHHLNKEKSKSNSYKLASQKARILHNYGEYFKKKNISTDLPYAQLRNIINEAKGRGDDERSLKIFLNAQGDYRNPKDIKVLDLSFKGLKTVPKSLKHLENLQEIDLSNNKLDSYSPIVLSNLKKLTHVRLGFNSIQFIEPKWYPKNCTVNVDNNPISPYERKRIEEQMRSENYQGPIVRF